MSYCPEATVTQRLIWIQGIPKRGILKNPVSHFLNLLGRIKLIFDTADLCSFVINEFNSTFKVQANGNGAFKKSCF